MTRLPRCRIELERAPFYNRFEFSKEYWLEEGCFFYLEKFRQIKRILFQPSRAVPRESLSANHMSKLNLAHLFPREQRRIPTEDEWFIIWRRPALVLPPLSRARHLWRSLIITSVIKRVEFFIWLSLSNTSLHNRLSPSNGTVHLARTSWHSLPRPTHIISSLFITFTLSNVIYRTLILFTEGSSVSNIPVSSRRCQKGLICHAS